MRTGLLRAPRAFREDSRTSTLGCYGNRQASWTPANILGCVSSGHGESRELERIEMEKVENGPKWVDKGPP